MGYAERFSANRVQWLYEVARSPELSSDAVRVGLLFATFVQPGREEVGPSYEWIMQNAHISRKTVAKALRALERAGYLDIHRTHRYRNRYSLPFDEEGNWVRKR